MRIVEDVIAETLDSGDALSLCQALVQAACPLALLTGALPRAERFVTMLTDCATRNAFRFWQIWARSFEGLALARHGDGKAGLPSLEAAIAELRSIEFGVHYTALLAGYAEALGRAGEVGQGLAVIDEALARSERNSERWLVADLLGIKAGLEIRRGAFATAENLFEQALDWARRQQALSWELRAAVGLARLWRAAGRDAEARTLVASCYQRFTEGFETADLVAARSFLKPSE
jgi:tetratricopeptide (TPR) repeat protein